MRLLTLALALLIAAPFAASAQSARTIAAAETPYPAPTTAFAPRNLKGLNIGGGEQHPETTRPYGYDYIYPRPVEMDYVAAKGFGLIRMPIDMRRLQPASYGALDPAPFGASAPNGGNLAAVKAVVDYALGKGLYVVIDPHNYGSVVDTLSGTTRIAGKDPEATAQLADWWGRVATKFRAYPNVIYGLMNEPVGMSAAQWYIAANADILAIRQAGAAQLILIPGGSNYTGAHDWTSSGNAAVWAGFHGDPGSNFAFEVHQYLDSDNSGTHPTAVVGKGAMVLDQLGGLATSWARTNGFRLFLGEFGWAADAQSMAEGKRLMDYVSANPDVWTGWSYWTGGSFAFYAQYPFSVMPGGSASVGYIDKPQMGVLAGHL